MDLVVIILLPKILTQIAYSLQNKASLKPGKAINILVTAVITFFFAILTLYNLYGQIGNYGPDTSGQPAVYNPQTIEELGL